MGDGTLVEYSNDEARARAHSQPATTTTMSFDALESAGRGFIASKLASQIVLGPGEALVPEAISNRTEGGGTTQGVIETARVTGNRIIFTREIDGVPVVGNGSKVIVTFLNDGTVESFRYDWPRYVNTGRVTASVGASEIVRRVQVIVGIRSGAPPQSFGAPAATTMPLSLDPNSKLDRLACGYFDAGLGNRAAGAVVQSGCYYHAMHSMTVDGMVLQAGYAGAVPGSAVPESDASWTELVALTGGKVPAIPPGDAAQPGPGTTPSRGK